MSTKILFVNGGSKLFGELFRTAASDHNVVCDSIRAHHNSYVHVGSHGVDYYHLGNKLDLESYDFVFFRVRSKYPHMVSLLAYLLESRGIPFNDSGNLEYTYTTEKVTQMVKFAENGIPIPESVIASKYSYRKNADHIQQLISYPCVMKTRGSQGEAVWKINSLEELEERIAETPDELFLIQEMIPNDGDIRALFFNDEPLGGILRTSRDGFYNNVSKGGAVTATDLSAEEIELSQKAMAVLDIDFAGVDFIRTDTGIVFLEINLGPQTYGFMEATGMDVPRELVRRIVDSLE